MQIQAYDATKLDWPMAWTAVFQRSAPLILEIGFGNAQFLVALAKQQPEANVLGIEISLPSIKKAESKIKNQNLDNLRVVHGDARLTLWGGVDGAQLEQVYINFPDPWHKAAHHHRKLINDEFLELLASRMTAGAKLEIATDDAGYQDHITECLERTPYFKSCIGRTYVTEDNERLRTKYELKALKEGRVCKYFKWERNDQPAGDGYPIPQELEMPHAIIQTPLPLAALSERFVPHENTSELPVRYIRHYLAPDGRTMLVETHIAEQPLPQRVGLFIQERPNDELADGWQEYVIGLHELGFPRPTHGVHRAIAHLASWLVGLDGETVVKNHNLSGGLPLKSGESADV